MKYTMDVINKKINELKKKYPIMNEALEVAFIIIDLQNILSHKSDVKIENDFERLEKKLSEIKVE